MWPVQLQLWGYPPLGTHWDAPTPEQLDNLLCVGIGQASQTGKGDHWGCSISILGLNVQCQLLAAGTNSWLDAEQ